jgi:glutamate-1-semialdehyde 2,1-aminomutase
MLNGVFDELDLPWAAYGAHSAVYLYTNPDGDPLDPLQFDAFACPHEKLRRTGKRPVVGKLRLALLLHGVDISSKPGGLTSCVHGDTDLEQTAEAFRRALHMLRQEGELAPTSA